MAGQRFKATTRKTYWRINQNIQAREVRAIGPDGKQLGIFSVSEALKEAEKAGLDLVEIAPHANPPVVKIIDFAKFRYQQEKKERDARKKEKKGRESKEVWLTPFIGTNDYQTRLEKIREFLIQGSKVRVVVRFKGNQMGRRQFGYEVSGKVVVDVQDIGGIDQSPKFLGRQLIMTLTPVKKQKIKEESEENKIQS